MEILLTFKGFILVIEADIEKEIKEEFRYLVLVGVEKGDPSHSLKLWRNKFCTHWWVTTLSVLLDLYSGGHDDSPRTPRQE